MQAVGNAVGGVPADVLSTEEFAATSKSLARVKAALPELRVTFRFDTGVPFGANLQRLQGVLTLTVAFNTSGASCRAAKLKNSRGVELG